MSPFFIKYISGEDFFLQALNPCKLLFIFLSILKKLQIQKKSVQMWMQRRNKQEIFAKNFEEKNENEKFSDFFWQFP